MTRGVNSNLPVPAVTYATAGRRGGGGHWLGGLLPWWGWLGLVVGFLGVAGIGTVTAFFAAIVAAGGYLIGLGGVTLVVIGVLVAIVGFGLRMIPHTEAWSKGHHMVRNGLLGGLFGLAIMFGGLNVAWGIGSLVVSDTMAGVRSRVHLPDAPSALQVQFPTLAGATSPAPTPTPHR